MLKPIAHARGRASASEDMYDTWLHTRIARNSEKPVTPVTPPPQAGSKTADEPLSLQELPPRPPDMPEHVTELAFNVCQGGFSWRQRRLTHVDEAVLKHLSDPETRAVTRAVTGLSHALSHVGPCDQAAKPGPDAGPVSDWPIGATAYECEGGQILTFAERAALYRQELHARQGESR